ncbi:uncharacterized protein BX663DRAFT_498984 [Cokeromyces recurvatus]|uniref:uncharacterized protein n=1 Tax=Cokeromyces recurvatus TaxID=90255 RepID=UPI00221FF6D1|nr:uncharacterized protein BX663DRAFT_498984 [Cokeromyces recurvatus]KAI7906148.1 hypothetical protein BX663DRAFT_498984 [Cokeromyces recurvatus]
MIIFILALLCPTFNTILTAVILFMFFNSKTPYTQMYRKGVYFAFAWLKELYYNYF